MKIDNVRQIRSEDFQQDHQQTISKLGEVLNSHMQQVVEMSNKNVDFDNKVEVLKTIDISVDSSGVPQLNNKINVGKTGIRGFQVISVFSLTSSKAYPSSQPFISYTPLEGMMVQIDRITGLQANNKYRITLIAF